LLFLACKDIKIFNNFQIFDQKCKRALQSLQRPSIEILPL